MTIPLLVLPGLSLFPSRWTLDSQVEACRRKTPPSAHNILLYMRRRKSSHFDAISMLTTQPCRTAINLCTLVATGTYRPGVPQLPLFIRILLIC